MCGYAKLKFPVPIAHRCTQSSIYSSHHLPSPITNPLPKPKKSTKSSSSAIDVPAYVTVAAIYHILLVKCKEIDHLTA